jgi:hypothetical protein
LGEKDAFEDLKFIGAGGGTIAGYEGVEGMFGLMDFTKD